MANRRCFQTLTRCLQSIKPLSPISRTLSAPSAHALNQTLTTTPPHYIFVNNFHIYQRGTVLTRNFSSKPTESDEDDDDDDEDDDEEDYDSEEENENQYESVVLSAEDKEREAAVSAEEKEKEAAEIGYKVTGPLLKSDRVFKPYEPVFAVVQIGSHQFKVSNRDTIYTERLKYCDINDKLVLNKVLMLGSQTQTIIGRPILPDAAVHAVVEEHALDAKVIIFKKKRRKNYRRKNGHRQELTKLRITDIQGIEKPEMTTPPKKEKAKPEKVKLEKVKPEKVAIAA